MIRRDVVERPFLDGGVSWEGVFCSAGATAVASEPLKFAGVDIGFQAAIVKRKCDFWGKGFSVCRPALQKAMVVASGNRFIFETLLSYTIAYGDTIQSGF